MAEFKSNLVSKMVRNRGLEEGKEYDIVGRIFLPSGTVLTAGDKLLAVPLGENQVVTNVRAYAIGATGAAEVSLGYFQQKDAKGNPAVVERLGPLEASGKYTSPVDDDDAYAAAAVLSTARDVVVTPTTKLAGPVNMGAVVTTGATLAADVELFIGATVIGEQNPDTLVDPYGEDNNDYLLNKP